jgi:D-inositol-3-phosphate glycosyltransferase
MGAKPQTELPLYFAAAEACVLPSRYESFGMVALESMACGTPVIASNVGGLSYTIKEGITGFLVPEGDAAALAERIQRVLNDSALRKKLSLEAIERARDFTWGRIGASTLQMYMDLMKSRNETASLRQRDAAGAEERAGS